MGKKSKKASKKTGANNGDSPVTVLVGVDGQGRMPERAGRRLYDLLSFLAEIALPKLEAVRKEIHKLNYIPLGWNMTGMCANSFELREIVTSFVLQEIDWLVEQVNSGAHDATYLRLFGRRITESDKNEIRSWKLHVQDDFFVTQHRPGEGAVLVQVGGVEKRDYLNREADFHEPRIFVVQSLADPLEYLTQRPVQDFRQEHPGLQKAYSELPLCVVHTTLLPYNGGIAYSTLLTPMMLENHCRTPKDLADATRIAVEATMSVFEEQDSSSSSAGCTLYRSLNPETDAHIRRLAHHQTSGSLLPMRGPEEHETRKKTLKEKGTTEIILNQMFWLPYSDLSNPKMKATLQRVNGGPKPFQLEGAKRNCIQSLVVRDDDNCPFHVRVGTTPPKFRDCCKDSFLLRKKKARETDNPSLIHLMYEPLEKPEAETIEAEASKTPNQVFDISKHLRIGYQDMGVVRLKIPPQSVAVIKARMDDCDIFHAILDYKWIYWGYIPASWGQLGIACMGDIQISPTTGVFEGMAMTSSRLENLIREMKYVCTGIPILQASLEMQPAHKVKPDKEALERNTKLLQEGLVDIEISSSVDKDENACMRKHCGYCGASEKQDGADLSRCPCKTAYYCCADHQKTHWPEHKDQCKAIRRRM